MPKTLYKSLSDEEANGSPIHDGNHIYQSIDLKPGQIHEVIIKNNDPSSVLTWDFDVMRSILKFSVFRTTKNLPALTGMVEYHKAMTQKINPHFRRILAR